MKEDYSTRIWCLLRLCGLSTRRIHASDGLDFEDFNFKRREIFQVHFIHTKLLVCGAQEDLKESAWQDEKCDKAY